VYEIYILVLYSIVLRSEMKPELHFVLLRTLIDEIQYNFYPTPQKHKTEAT